MHTVFTIFIPIVSTNVFLRNRNVWEKKMLTWEKRGEVVYSTDIFYVKVECHYHNHFLLFHTVLWPFLNRGSKNLRSPRKLIFISVSRLDVLQYFMVSWFKLLCLSKNILLFLLEINIIYMCHTVYNYTRDIF